MADHISKSVAARVPMDTYIEIIKAAAELKMTVSDYLIMKLFQESKNEQLQQDLAEKEKAISQIKSELAEVQKEKKKLETVKADSAIGSKEKDTKVKEQATKITSLATENTSLKAEITRLKAGNITTNTTLNTNKERVSQLESRLLQSDSRLAESESSLRLCQKAKNTADVKITKLEDEIKRLNSCIQSDQKTSILVYKELEQFNERNSTFLGGNPIGDEFMGKIKKLLNA